MDFDAALPETRITITQRLKEIRQSSRKVEFADLDYWWRFTVLPCASLTMSKSSSIPSRATRALAMCPDWFATFLLQSLKPPIQAIPNRIRIHVKQMKFLACIPLR